LGPKRRVHTVKLYLVDDGEKVTAPAQIELEYWDDKGWARVPEQTRDPKAPTGHRANVIHFPELRTEKIRAVFTHDRGGRTGLTEFEIWGDAGPVD
jgi:hypothetical protein